MKGHAIRGATARRHSLARRTDSLVPCGGRRHARRISALLLGCIAVCFGPIGCVERRMTIRTNVDSQGGALAIVDGQELGTTPVSTGFTYYGDRKIRLIKDGYETVTLVQPIRAPWWDSLLTEFFTENLWPRTVRDEREFRYALPPQLNVTNEEVLGRADRLRREGQQSAESLPAGPGAPPRPLTF